MRFLLVHIVMIECIVIVVICGAINDWLIIIIIIIIISIIFIIIRIHLIIITIIIIIIFVVGVIIHGDIVPIRSIDIIGVIMTIKGCIAL